MARWENFEIWRGRLPHWRADGVTYYVTFRHKRALNPLELSLLFTQFLKTSGRQISLVALCVLPEATEILFTVNIAPNERPYEFSDVIEKAKAKAGKAIIAKSGERFPPFYHESFDRIVRDDLELEQLYETILASPIAAELAQEPEEWEYLYVPGLI